MGHTIYKPKHRRTSSTFSPRKFDAERDRRQALYHDGIWREFSHSFLKENPECYVCGLKSEATDHIEPHLGRPDVFKRFANHIALCHKCHNTVTAKFDQRFHAGNDTAPKIKWMNDERAKNEVLSQRTFKRPKAMEYK